jgi:hypothetical protein
VTRPDSVHPWSNPEADILSDIRALMDRCAAEPYRPDVYYLTPAAYAQGVAEGLIASTDPLWQPYPEGAS